VGGRILVLDVALVVDHIGVIVENDFVAVIDDHVGVLGHHLVDQFEFREKR